MEDELDPSLFEEFDDEDFEALELDEEDLEDLEEFLTEEDGFEGEEA